MFFFFFMTSSPAGALAPRLLRVFHSSATVLLWGTALAWLALLGLCVFVFQSPVEGPLDPRRVREFFLLLVLGLSEQALFFVALVWSARRLAGVTLASAAPRPASDIVLAGDPALRTLTEHLTRVGAIAVAWPTADFVLGLVLGPVLRAHFGEEFLPGLLTLSTPAGGSFFDWLVRAGATVNVPLLFVGGALLIAATVSRHAALRLRLQATELAGVV